jgi:hypothetical protein
VPFPTFRFTSVLKHIVAYLLKARTVKPSKQPLLGDDYITRSNGITDGSDVFCAVRTENM